MTSQLVSSTSTSTSTYEFPSSPSDNAASRLGFSVCLVSVDHTPFPLVTDARTNHVYAVIPANTEYEICVKAPAPQTQVNYTSYRINVTIDGNKRRYSRHIAKLSNHSIHTDYIQGWINPTPSGMLNQRFKTASVIHGEHGTAAATGTKLGVIQVTIERATMKDHIPSSSKPTPVTSTAAPTTRVRLPKMTSTKFFEDPPLQTTHGTTLGYIAPGKRISVPLKQNAMITTLELNYATLETLELRGIIQRDNPHDAHIFSHPLLGASQQVEMKSSSQATCSSSSVKSHVAAPGGAPLLHETSMDEEALLAMAIRESLTTATATRIKKEPSSRKRSAEIITETCDLTEDDTETWVTIKKKKPAVQAHLLEE